MEGPTHYHVLGISSSLLESQADPSALLKRAYRRALLRHHPDKSRSQAHHADPHAQTCSPASASCTARRRGGSVPDFSVDQISSALAVLSSPRRRAEYDASLRVSRAAAGRADRDVATQFQTGIESVDLDDLELDDGGLNDGGLDDQGLDDERAARWHRSCRCGNERGYVFGEEDLVEVEHEGVLMVGCQDCSLWLQVHFAVLEEEEGADDGDQQDDGRHRDRAQAMSNGKTPSH